MRLALKLAVTFYVDDMLRDLHALHACWGW